MEFWDTVINTAMLGTDKKQISTTDLPSDLVEAAKYIRENETRDKEERFLQLVSLAFNYRQCGVLPSKKEIMMPALPAEEKKYCNTDATQALTDILCEESMPLLKFWLRHCNDQQQVAPPTLIPALLTVGVQQKKLQWLIAQCCGKRGEWLAGFNHAWNYSSHQTDEELWQTGTLEQRKEVLKQTRNNDPVKGREWIQSTWAQEDANTKTALIDIMEDDVCESDITFLESLSTEKSKKVKDAAMRLLKRIPGSSVLQLYQDLLKQSVSTKKEKTLLGMMNKTVIQFQLPDNVPEEVFKSGIEKLSSNKNISDESFIFYQLISYTPVVFWEQHFACSSSEVIELFKRSEEGKQMLPAVGLAVGRFGNASWATFFTNEERSFYSDLLPLLTKREREKYLLKFIEDNTMTETVIRYVMREEEEWGEELTRAVFRHTAKTPYQYNRSFYNQYIDRIPIQIIGELEKFTPAEEHLRTMWSNMSEYIIKLSTLKIQTLKAFK